ncbi:phospho-N-acetylmuramoyl-pentapeptide-transferase [Dokdonia sp. Hel_I_53]|uniref:phospho-N-acetylmuramoyl-pentapeptide- transferase n=1 Tax=Dokdonia sp. Hel_I_53 TaxID=1566287 RepID=UPI001198D1F7|nr:phospho-N-acetylmuramoyl-pentapeptide-transferase [Dokdonia sp. Hel_I_53]TVZ51997.1 phospho-N-acetylmuramoyl-pentapeptide-transferase [Dokdonia sp. Hel_I_53]
MLYHLFQWLDEAYNVPGAGLFQFSTFRAALAILLSLTLSTVYGERIIKFLQRKQMGEQIRDLGLDGQAEKAGTPTMGGLIIIASTLIPVILFANLDNIYIVLLIITTVWMGIIGFIDDYKKKMEKNKEGLSGKYKIIGQVGLGIIVGTTMFFHSDITVREEIKSYKGSEKVEITQEKRSDKFTKGVKSLKTTLPFTKNNEFDYEAIVTAINEDWKDYAWLLFIPIVIIIITAVSNGANLTDGIDGLAAGTSAIIVLTLGIFAFVSGNIIFSDYLNVMYIPGTGEMLIFIAAFVGALIGFLWYNAYPAQVFMGDTGSLTIGGIIAVLAIATRKEWLIPILCGIFLMENLSVIMQVGYFKYTKKKTGEGRRIFLMSPLHHHYQKKGVHESKIVTRFWIVGILLAVLSIITLKIR